MARLYSLGAFEILLWKLLAGDLMDWEKDLICKFLLQVHLHQVCHLIFWHFPGLNTMQVSTSQLTISSKLGISLLVYMLQS